MIQKKMSAELIKQNKMAAQKNTANLTKKK